MRTKLLLLLCCLFAIEGWAKTNEIHLKRSDGISSPVGIPIPPPTEKCAIFSNTLNINFDSIEASAVITITNKITGEIVYLHTYHNTNFTMIDMSACAKGVYTIHITMNDRSLEGTFII